MTETKSDDWTRQKENLHKDRDFADTTCSTATEQQSSSCLLTFQSRVAASSTDCLPCCKYGRTDAADDQAGGDRAKMSSLEFGGSRTGNVVDAIRAALHSGLRLRVDNALPNVPFLEVFNGVVSRRAVLEVSTLLFCRVRPRAGSGVVRMDPLCFLAGCRTRRLNQA